MEEYGIMEYLELTVTRCGRWRGNREFIWSSLMLIILPIMLCCTVQHFAKLMLNVYLSSVCSKYLRRGSYAWENFREVHSTLYTGIKVSRCCMILHTDLLLYKYKHVEANLRKNFAIATAIAKFAKLFPPTVCSIFIPQFPYFSSKLALYWKTVSC